MCAVFWPTASDLRPILWRDFVGAGLGCAMSAPHASSVDEREIEKFAALAEAWWHPDGELRPLHRFNPARLQFIRDVALAHFGRDAKSLKPFGGLTLLDIGCGGGLLSGPMARRGFPVL